MARLDGWQFCPRCGARGEHRGPSFACPECGHLEWSNPVPGSQAVLEQDGRVLLGRRRFEPSQGLWDLPGGFVDEHEHPLEALHRELGEETGLEIEPVEFLGIWMQRYAGRMVLCLTWLAHPVGGVEAPGDDLVELRWFRPDELPGPGELAFETFVDILALWRARHENP